MAATLDNRMTKIVSRNIDQGYAWIILLASFTSLFILAVLVYSTGMVYTAVLEHVNKDLVRASWVGSTLMGTYLFSGPVAGMMTSTFGCRTMAVVGGILILLGMTAAFFCKTVLTLILTYGVVTGLGIGFVHNAVIVVVGYYFQKRIAFASGISTSGAGLGMLAGAPIVRAILDGFGLNGTLLLLGSFGAQTCILGMLLRPSPIEREKSKQCRFWKKRRNLELPCDNSGECQQNNFHPCFWCKNRESNSSDLKNDEHFNKRNMFFNMASEWSSIFKNFAFILYLFSLFFWGVGESICVVHLPNYVMSKGTSEAASANLFPAMGAGSLLSRLLTGFAAGDHEIDSLVLHMGLLGVASFLTLLFPLYSHSLQSQMFFSAAYGLYSGGPNSLFNPLTVELLGLKNLANGFGIKDLFLGFAYFTGPPVGGVIADIGGEYDYTFIFSGAVILFGSLVSIGIGIFRRKATTEKKTTVMLLPGSEDQEENHDESVPFNVATSMGYHDECSDQYV